MILGLIWLAWPVALYAARDWVNALRVALLAHDDLLPELREAGLAALRVIIQRIGVGSA